MSTEREQLQAGIAALESQRGLLGDTVAEAALALLRAKLAATNAVHPFPAEQTLRQVTILFLDVVGSTTLSQHLDPEDIHAVMDGALARCTGIVESHKGKVLQYAGDSLLAVFGADEVQEDDAERAVSAGLALLAEGHLLAEEVRRQFGHDGFNVRVGLHTGGVLLGGGVDAGGSIRGIAVNIAARMEQTAPAGCLRISRDTYRHVRGVFDVEPQAPIAVKGLDEPIATYLVQRAKPRAFRVATRGIEGIETCMIGRDAELKALQDAFERLFSERKFGLVTVVAEAGIGKSRLLYEFENWAEERPEAFYVFQGRANPQTQRQPYGLLRDIVAWRYQIADSDSMQVAKAKLEQGLAPLFVSDHGVDMAQAHVHLLGHLIGLNFSDSRHVGGILDDPKQIRDRGFHAAALMFRQVTAQGSMPVLLLLDDLHWADDGSLDVLNHVAQVSRNVPMLMLALTRPTLFERRTDWGSAEGIPRRIDLGPLDDGARHLLAKELLKKLREIPDALSELIIGRAEGNPYYMEELVKMLVDEGAIETDPDRWTLHPEKLRSTHVPQTLTDVLQARLDGLPPREKLALQQASVIGLVFWDEALGAIDPASVEALPSLVQRELAVPRQNTSLDDVREYAFRHQILHQVTYDTLLKRTRRECHGRTAAWLAGLSGARASDFLGAAADHYEKAGDSTRASEFFARAAEHAAGRNAHEAVMDSVARGLTLLGHNGQPDDLPVRWRLLDVRERTLDVQGRRDEQRVDIDALRQIADELDDDGRRIEASLRFCNLAFRTGEYHAAQAEANLALDLAKRAGATPLVLRAQHLLAIALQSLGELRPARALVLESLAAARAIGDRRLESRLVNALAVIAAREGDLVAGHEHDKEVLQICRELGNRRDEAVALSNIGLSLVGFGDHVGASKYLEEGLRMARAVGARFVEPHALRHLAALELRLGDAVAARAHARSALEMSTELQDPSAQSVCVLSLADAELALGQIEAAGAAYRRAHTLCAELQHPIALDARAGLARVALARGELTDALTQVEALLDHFTEHGNFEGTDSPQLIHLSCHRVLQHLADSRATAVLERAHRELQDEAARISDDALRDSFLSAIPEHRDIAAAWAASQAVGSVQT